MVKKEVIEGAKKILDERQAKWHREHPGYKPENPIAPKGKIWLCTACGKTSPHRYGTSGSGWDEACMLNSELINIK
jgi:hypothetical protein